MGNPAGVNSGEAVGVANAAAVAHQPAGGDDLAVFLHRRAVTPQRQLRAPVVAFDEPANDRTSGRTADPRPVPVQPSTSFAAVHESVVGTEGTYQGNLTMSALGKADVMCTF
jgi:hypothetical protein